jgi:hypothetical protein
VCYASTVDRFFSRAVFFLGAPPRGWRIEGIFDIGHGQDDLPIASDTDEGVGREAIGVSRFDITVSDRQARLSIRPPPAPAPARRKLRRER